MALLMAASILAWKPDWLPFSEKKDWLPGRPTNSASEMNPSASASLVTASLNVFWVNSRMALYSGAVLGSLVYLVFASRRESQPLRQPAANYWTSSLFAP